MNFRLKRQLLILVTIHEFFEPVQSVNGLIWDKKIGNFVPIFNVPAFAAVNQKILSQSRNKEIYNFQGQIVRFTYYEETNIIHSHENGTRITGIIGEIWNTLAELLNFTITPIRSHERSLGLWVTDKPYISGLLKIIYDNETDVIARVEAHATRLNATQFTIPLWLTSFRLYIRREVKHSPTWILKLFSPKVWIAILITYLLLTACGYFCQMINSKFTIKEVKPEISEHFFNNFGMICGQGYQQNPVSESSKIVELWCGLFSCLVRTALGALLIRYMTQTVNTAPFYDIHSLVDNSPYSVITLRGSLPYLVIQSGNLDGYNRIAKENRHYVADTVEEMYRTVCHSEKPYAICQSEDIKKARGMYYCRLNPVGISLAELWIASGIARNFTYKRSIDIGLLRLYEIGYIKFLKHRWIETKNAEDTPSMTEPIVMDQMRAIILIFATGFCLSVIILLLENVTFIYNNSRINYVKNHR